MADITTLDQQITALQIIVSSNFDSYQAAKNLFTSARAKWDSSVLDLQDLNTQKNALTNGK